MSEIEKMMQNANIISKRCSECDNNNMDCGYGKDCYPPFTAEKQIELIKWLVCTGEEISISGHRKGNLYWMSTNVDNKEQASTFGETLAGLINNLWQDLTSEQKQQVKGILE